MGPQLNKNSPNFLMNGEMRENISNQNLDFVSGTIGQMIPFLCFSLLCVISVLFIDPRDSLKDKIDMKKVVTVAEPAKVDPKPRARGSRDMI